MIREQAPPPVDSLNHLSLVGLLISMHLERRDGYI